MGGLDFLFLSRRISPHPLPYPETLHEAGNIPGLADDRQRRYFCGGILDCSVGLVFLGFVSAHDKPGSGLKTLFSQEYSCARRELNSEPLPSEGSALSN